MRFRVLTTAFLGAFLAVSATLAGAVRSEAQTIFAAASMTDAIRQVNDLWTAKGNAPFSFSFASSSTLAQQIEQGAEATIFISADERWMNHLQERGLIAEDTRISALGNRLVLVAPADSDVKVELGKDTDLAALLGADGRLATGDPQHVPVGRYAQQALTALGQWDALNPRLARADSVRSALLLVERGEAPLGIVYATDAAISKGVKVVGVFPEDLHDRVSYPFAVVKAADSPAAREALAFLVGDEAAQVYERLGFSRRQ